MKTLTSIFTKLAILSVLVLGATVSAQQVVPTTPQLMFLLDEACAVGETLCSANCTDIQSNLDHCGACDSFCSGWCGSGSCLTEGACAGGAPPASESCNFIDDDCDGVVDGASANASCDDGNQCTLNICAPGTGCTNTPAPNGTPCDDGDPMTTNDMCQAGAICTGSP